MSIFAPLRRTLTGLTLVAFLASNVGATPRGALQTGKSARAAAPRGARGDASSPTKRRTSKQRLGDHHGNTASPSLEPARLAASLMRKVTKVRKLSAATTQAIAVTKQELAATETHIAKMEAEIQTKQGQATSMLADITAKRAEIESNRNLTGLLGVFGALLTGPVFGIVAGAMVVQQEQTLQAATTQLSTLQAEQARLQSDQQVYKDKKVVLTAKLDLLRASEVRSVKTLARLDSEAGTGDPANPRLALKHATTRLRTSRTVLKNVKEQLALALSIRDAVAVLGIKLDAHIVSLQAAVVAAQEMVDASNDLLIQMVLIAVAPDPAMAAVGWLERGLMRKVASELREAGLPMEFADLLAEKILGEVDLRQAFASGVRAEMRAL